MNNYLLLLCLQFTYSVYLNMTCVQMKNKLIIYFSYFFIYFNIYFRFC